MFASMSYSYNLFHHWCPTVLKKSNSCPICKMFQVRIIVIASQKT